MSTIEQVELNEDIYANNGDESQRRDDLDEEQVDPDLQGGITTQNGKDKFTRGDSREVKCYRVAVVGLGPLCVLLLVIIIRLATKHITGTQRLESQIKQLKLNNDDLTQQLQANIANLTQEKDNMMKCVLAQENKDLTITILTQEKDQLRDSITILTQEKDQLRTVNSNLTQYIEQLRTTICRLNMLGDWRSFGSSCYYISSDERNWADSQQHCMDLGGHLVIIDSQEEQEFINTQIKSIYAETRAWIGLSDLETEGVWKWVDGKPLSKFGFWMQDEPNDDKGAEDCVETLYQYNPLKTWNDAICSMAKHCICEMYLT